MTAHDDLDRRLDDFLGDGPTELSVESFHAIRDRTEQTRQRVFIGPWRMPDMSKIVPLGLGAAAVVVALVVGAQWLAPPAPGVGGVPSPSPSPSPSASPSPSPDAGLPEGPYSFEPDGSFSPTDSGMTLTVSIPSSGWSFDDSWNLLGRPGDNDPFAAFWAFPDEEFYVPADPCRADSTRPETPATTVDEFAAALAAQASRDATEPVDVTIGGYAGKSLTLHAPEGVADTDCERDGIVTYFTSTLGSDDFWRNTQRPDEVSELWILDVDGTTLIIDMVSSPGNPAELVDELRGVVESTTISK